MAAHTTRRLTPVPQQAMAMNASPTCKANGPRTAALRAASHVHVHVQQTQGTRPVSRGPLRSSWGVRWPKQSRALGKCAWGVDLQSEPRPCATARIHRAVSELQAQSDKASFNEILAGSDIVIGTAIPGTRKLPPEGRTEQTSLTPDDKLRTFLLDNFSLFVAENAMKPESIIVRENGEFKWNDEANRLIAFVRDNKRRLKGHTLAWHAQIQVGLKKEGLSHEEKRTIIRDHVGGVAAMMGGAGCGVIDVVNEAIGSTSLRSFWTSDLGFLKYSEAVKFLAELFTVARAGAPNARLCINDFDTTDVNDKSTALFDLCKAIKKEEKGGLSILDEVGFQAHEDLGRIRGSDFFDSMTRNMARFKGIGMTCNISELDLVCDGFGATARDAAEAAAPYWYRFITTALMDRSVCTSLTIWGFDNYTSFQRTRTDGYAHETLRFPVLPWTADSEGNLVETPIGGAIRRALRDLQVGPQWQAFGCDVGPGFLTQNRSGGTFSGPQFQLPPNTDCSLKTSVVSSREVWLTLKSSDKEFSDFDFANFSAQKLADGPVTFRTTGKPYNVVYLEGPPLGTEFVVGSTFLNGQPITWEPTFPANGTLRRITFASGRKAPFAGLMVTPDEGKTWTLTTKVYSRQPLKLTLKFWDVSTGQFKFEPLARADSAGSITATFFVPAAAPNGEKAQAFIESDSGQGGVEDYAAEAPKLSL